MRKDTGNETTLKIIFWSFAIIIILINFYLGLNKKLWLDEVATIKYTDVNTVNQLISNIYNGTDINPPLFYSLFFFIRKILPDNIITYRIFILLINLLSLLIIIKIFKKIFIYNSAYLIVSFLAVTSFFSQYLILELRSYSLYFLLFLVFIYFWLKIQNNGEVLKNDLIIISITSILLIYTHYYAIPYVFLLLLIMPFKKKNFVLWFPFLIVLFSFIPLLIFLVNQLSVFHGNYWQPLPSIKQFLYLPFFYFGKGIIVVIIFLIIITIIGFFNRNSILRDNIKSVLKNFYWVVFLFPLLDFIFSSFGLLVFVERYFIPTFIGFIIIIGVLLQKLLINNLLKTIFLFLLLFLGVYRIVKFDNIINQYNKKIDMYVKYEKEGKPIVCVCPHMFYPLEYYSKNKSFWLVTDSTSASIKGNISNSKFDYYWNKKMEKYYNIDNIMEWKKFKYDHIEFFVINEEGRMLFEYYMENSDNYFVKNIKDNLFFVSNKEKKM